MKKTIMEEMEEINEATAKLKEEIEEPTFRVEDDEFWAEVQAHEEINSKHALENK